MKLRALQGVLIAAVIVLLCGFACNSNTTHKINQANKEISDGLAELQSQGQSLYTQKVIDAQDAAAIQNFVIEATGDHKVLTAQLRSFNSQPATTDQYLAYIQDFVSKVKGINLHVKSTQGQEVVTVFFASFDAAIQTLRTTIQTIKTGQSNEAPEDRTPMRASIDEITLGLAAFTSLSKLIGSWLANGKLTDQQLQDAADAEDDATNKAAMAFLQSLPKQ